MGFRLVVAVAAALFDVAERLSSLLEFELLNLAARGARQIRHQCDPLGPKLLGHLAFSEVGLHRREVDRSARLRYDKGAAAFAQTGIGVTDNRNRSNGRMLVEKIFDLHHRDVLASPDQYVFHPTRYTDVTFAIHVSEVSRVEPSLLIKCFQFRLLVITGEHLTAAHQQTPELSCPNRLSVQIHDTDTHLSETLPVSCWTLL